MKIANNIKFNELWLILSKIPFEMYAPQNQIQSSGGSFYYKYCIMSNDGAGFTPVSRHCRIENKYFLISNHLLTTNKGRTWTSMVGFPAYTATKFIIEETYKQKIKHRNKQRLQSKLKNQFIKIK